MILKEEGPERTLQRAEDLGILSQVHPSLGGGDWIGSSFRRARSMVSPVPRGVYLSLMVYHLDSRGVEEFLSFFRFPRRLARVVRDTLRLKENLCELASPDLAPSAVYLALDGYELSSILACTVATEVDSVSRHLKLYLDKLRHVRISLKGSDLRDMGVGTGTQLGEVLRALLMAKLDGKVTSREEEEELVYTWISKSRGG